MSLKWRLIAEALPRTVPPQFAFDDV